MGCHRLFPFEARRRLGADFARRLSVTPTRQVPQLVVRRAWRKLGRLRRRAPGVAGPAQPVWVYTPGVQLGPLPPGFVASGDWPTILGAIQHEQQTRQAVRVLVYTCAPLQVLT
jgi:hypothetical protein